MNNQNLLNDVRNLGKLKFRFNPKEIKFRECLSQVFSENDLSSIHLSQDCNFGILTIETDQGTHLHKKFYEKIWETNFFDLYLEFLKEEIFQRFDEDVLYQKIPTFRIQVPNNLGVASFHKDKDYSHGEDEINIFLPLTDAIGNNTIWVESKEDLGDYSPMDALYGEYYIWNGANLSHGNQINNTGKTRISIDFRVLPLSKYNEDIVKETITMGTKIKLGEYFDIFKK